MVDHYSNPVSIVRSFDLGDVIRYPLLLISGIWNLAAGSFLKSFGSIFAGGFKTGLPVAAGFVAFGVCWAIQLRSTSPAATEKAIRRVPLRVLATVLACIAIGTVPVIAMNFAPHERFLIPVLPFAAIATVLIADVVIGAKLRWLCVCVLMFVATYATAQKVTKVVFLAKSIRIWGGALHPVVPQHGQVVALFTPAGSEQLNIHWFEFTPQLSMSWPPADRHRFLAFANLGEMFTHVERSGNPPSLQLSCTSRRFERKGSLDIVYFLVVREDMSVDIVRNNLLNTKFIAEGK